MIKQLPILSDWIKANSVWECDDISEYHVQPNVREKGNTDIVILVGYRLTHQGWSYLIIIETGHGDDWKSTSWDCNEVSEMNDIATKWLNGELNHA